VSCTPFGCSLSVYLQTDSLLVRTPVHHTEFEIRPKEPLLSSHMLDVVYSPVTKKKNDVLLNLVCVHVHVSMQQSTNMANNK
jgi:hypothetical protein